MGHGDVSRVPLSAGQEKRQTVSRVAFFFLYEYTPYEANIIY